MTTPLAGRTAATAVTLLFVVNGLLLGGYGGALPSLRAKLDIEAGEIAVALFCAGAAAITSMQIGGRLADSLGARRVTLVGLPVLIAGAVVLGIAPTYAVAVVGAMLIGFGNGALDVAMNAIGVQVEAARGRAIMSYFHAMWSVGNFIGAGTVLLLATALGLTGGEIVMPLMLVLAGLAVCALVVLVRITPHAAVVEHKVDGV
ncbi:MAG TPA: MFS transporter, partial [Propionibacteriaceae bacterium]|nr:MFS transporter [Propionibacteriaceae bacterium]